MKSSKILKQLTHILQNLLLIILVSILFAKTSFAITNEEIILQQEQNQQIRKK